MESTVKSSSTLSSNSPPASFNQHQFQTPNSEVCAICCSVLQSESLTDAEELAKLECDHIFHFSCIQAWSEVSSTCPFDRRPFTTLKITESIDGPTIRIVPIESKVQNVSSTYQNGFPINGETEADGRNLYDSANCVVCGRSDREEVLLLCDDCDDGE
ncbi:hypothetical protein BKA69DRAFT_467387 [Paraphysoderma sedebokerense]|nr:hypothetical protein BKA69DRAFT_467387 [Paraphysoderma sedebokerense]